MQSLTLWKKIVMWFVCMPLVPIFCLIYIVMPHTKVQSVTLFCIFYYSLPTGSCRFLLNVQNGRKVHIPYSSQAALWAGARGVDLSYCGDSSANFKLKR